MPIRNSKIKAYSGLLLRETGAKGNCAMKLLRPVLIASIFVGAFFYFTTYRSTRSWPSWISRPDKVEITEAASGNPEDAEEQNNISVYRKNVESADSTFLR